MRGRELNRKCKYCGKKMHELKPVRSWFGEEVWAKDAPAYVCLYCDALEESPLEPIDRGD